MKRVERGRCYLTSASFFPTSTLQTGFVSAVADGFVLEPAFSEGFPASQTGVPQSSGTDGAPGVQEGLSHAVMTMHSQFRAGAAA